MILSDKGSSIKKETRKEEIFIVIFDSDIDIVIFGKENWREIWGKKSYISLVCICSVGTCSNIFTTEKEY